MIYSRNIKDRLADGDNRYNITLDNGTSILTPTPVSVSEEGTPINKALLQPIEDRTVWLMNKFDKTDAENLAIGDNTLRDNNNVVGKQNVAIGHNALIYNNTGAKNTVIGHSALSQNVTNFQNVIAIGANCAFHGNNTAHIGNTETLNISFGAGVGTAFTQRSDPRLKENITDADTLICLTDINKLKPKRFKYKNFIKNTQDKHITGFLSTEFKEVFPKAVTSADMVYEDIDDKGDIIFEELENGGYSQKFVEVLNCESIDTSQIVPTLVGAIQELTKQIEVLKQEINFLKNGGVNA